MKKIFLIPLLACFSCVMAWAEGEVVVNDFATLKTQLSASGTADVVKLGQDIAYPTNGSNLLNIERSLTLDGQNYTINGWGVCNVYCPKDANDTKTENHPTVLAINSGNTGSNLVVSINNLKIGNPDPGTSRVYGIVAFDGVSTLNFDNCDIKVGSASYRMAITINGTSTTKLNLNVTNTVVYSGVNTGYPFYILKPVDMEMEDCTITGYCGLYFKYRETGAYGYVAGARGSEVVCSSTYFECINTSHGNNDNDFGIFAFEDDGIDLTVNNCGMNATAYGDEWQSVVYMKSDWQPGLDSKFGTVNGGTTKYGTRDDAQDVNITINGDNSHINGRFVYHDGTAKYNKELADRNVRTKINYTITGGTYAQNPATTLYNQILTENGGGTFETANFTIPSTHEVQTIKQGDATLYRVVKKVEKNGSGDPLYNLNDNVETAGAGQNPVTSFELSDGSDMTLNQQVTKAGYVQVMDDATEGATTVTIGKDSGTDKDQTLIINNGLDVQGDSKVEVKAGSTLEIGEGGINTQKPENIVINADENGAASLLLEPTITVNQTPNLTVKMKAKQIGADTDGKYHWHRFAMPVAAGITSWQKEGTSALTNDYPTYLYGWDYVNNQWLKLTNGVSDMVPLMGYTLTLASDEIDGWQGALEDVTYIFKGNLVGNTNQALNFQAEGFNFFGNSYTGYMDVLTLIQGLESNNVEGTVYMWCNDPDEEEYQSYVGVSLYRLQNLPFTLASWQKEVAPMQTFILRLRGADSANEEVDYASAIWGNPRYGHSTTTSAPRRQAAALNDNTYMEIVVKGANGKGDCIDFAEDANHTDAFESGYDVVKYMNENRINLYTTLANEKFSSVVTDNVLGKTINIQTTSDINYTMTFKNLSGNEYAIRDNATGKVINMEEGASYEFSAQPNSTVEGRFEIVNVNKAPTAIENTEVKANVKGIYTLMGQYVGEDFNTLPAGVYVVDGVKIVK